MLKITPSGLVLAALLSLGAPPQLHSAETGEWQLVWADEFETDGSPNPQFWDYEQGYIRNNELQYYTANRSENCRVENGSLIIEARRDNFEGRSVTSASLTTRRSASWTYGRIEVRAQLAPGRGTWPAIWMLGDNIDEVGWPHCGEIDIMEFVGYDPNTVHGTIHTTAYNHIQNTERNGHLEFDDLTTAMHVYSVEWEADEMRFYVDDQLYFTFQNDGQNNDATWPFHRPQHLKLNLAIGGDWGGAQGVDSSIYPTQFLVDYVRVYQRKQSPPYSVNLNASGPGIVEIHPAKEHYQDGEVVTLVADPDLGMRLGKWKNAQLERQLETQIVVNRSLDITADFVDPNALNRNSDFSSSLSGWYNYIDSSATASITQSPAGEAKIAISKAGSQHWHVQFGQGNLSLENGKRYELSFDAKTESGSLSLIAALAMNAEPYTTYSEKTFQLDTNTQRHTLEFTHTSSSNPNSRIEFRLGQANGTALLDNVQLRSLDDEALTAYEAWKRDNGIRPNQDALDPDSDSRPNILEYLWQSSPTQSDPRRPSLAAHAASAGLQISPANFPATLEQQQGIATSLEHSQDLQIWNDGENPSARFHRLKVIAAPPIDD
ncbi:family 16 glycosylhydrolase [Pelagicoccus mobilis]|uniref:Family 16 glycosylhydrolase n=1 Tax=Pelagicoccus mobilis TaxID=415221 RepID=A0A934RYN5_9BACT|nr:family 16 glycosylhydrolase [Pelagicoccus mobilis]MBK1877920.1 family 16 glycosylhydrolase [Pelagicoccus mobilis]